MALRVGACVAVGLGMLALPSGARGTDLGSNMIACQGRAAVNTVASRVAACTTLIAAGGQPKAVTATGYFMRANIYLSLRDYDRAIADYTQALDLLPNEPLLLNNRCWARALQGRDLEDALADCGELVRRQPNWATAHDTRGFVLLRLGRLDEAIGEFDVSLNANPSPNALQASSLYARGVAEERKGDAADGDLDMQMAESIFANIAQQFASYGVAP
jgi:tetratricopeptide (TPR) repeat protein